MKIKIVYLIILASALLFGGPATAQTFVTIDVKDSTVTISGSVMVVGSGTQVISFVEVGKNSIIVTIETVAHNGHEDPARVSRRFSKVIEGVAQGTYVVKVYYGWLVREETIEVKDSKYGSQ
ncbi:MAG: hypothetical protein HZA13_02095 [Nitrospirae bacterium]|nr:hypothetical protein [Nitrospirota bacterium]